MTQLTTLTREQIRDVLVGLADSAQPEARIRGIGAMADALTTTRPVDPDLELLRYRLANLVGAVCELGEAPHTDEDLLARLLGRLSALTEAGDNFRGMLTTLLELDPWASDEEITEAAAARAAQRAQQRAQEKTQAFIALDELQQALAVLETRRARDDVERQALQVVRQRLDELDRRLTSAGKRIEAVRQLHSRLLIGEGPSGKDYVCSTCNAEAAVAGTPARWPCPTISALDGS